MSQLLEYTKKIDKKSRENIEKLFLGQNFLKRIMSKISNYTKKLTKIEKKIEKLFLVQNFLKRIMSQLLDNTKKNYKKSRKKSKN